MLETRMIGQMADNGPGVSLIGLTHSFLAFAAYFGAAVILTSLFVLIYIRVTPHNEIKLMREGNGAAALGLTGALLGFAIPLALVIGVSGGLMQTVAWGVGALLVQTAGQFGARLLFPSLTTDIVAGKYSAAIVQSGIALSLGILQAACWVP
jgi:putative membrane protein